MDPEIREAILGHSNRTLSVRERYGRISDHELLRAIDQMTFDHGNTEILVARHRHRVSRDRGNQKVTKWQQNGNKSRSQKKGHGAP